MREGFAITARGETHPADGRGQPGWPGTQDKGKLCSLCPHTPPSPKGALRPSVFRKRGLFRSEVGCVCGGLNLPLRACPIPHQAPPNWLSTMACLVKACWEGWPLLPWEGAGYCRRVSSPAHLQSEPFWAPRTWDNAPVGQGSPHWRSLGTSALGAHTRFEKWRGLQKGIILV